MAKRDALPRLGRLLLRFHLRFLSLALCLYLVENVPRPNIHLKMASTFSLSDLLLHSAYVNFQALALLRRLPGDMPALRTFISSVSSLSSHGTSSVWTRGTPAGSERPLSQALPLGTGRSPPTQAFSREALRRHTPEPGLRERLSPTVLPALTSTCPRPGSFCSRPSRPGNRDKWLGPGVEAADREGSS